MIWDDLAKRHGFSSSPYILSDMKGLEALWGSIGKGKLEHWEELVLACTFDFVWVPRELVQEAAEGFKRWFARISEGKPNLVPTAAGIGRVMLEILEKHPDCLGVAYNMCSANSAFWYVYESDEDREIGVDRPYNILTDAEQPTGQYKSKKPESVAEILNGS
jgi:hypothetical protein